MLELIGAAGAIAAATLSPGPNNFVVMRAAARGGVRGALPAIAGIVSGSLLLLAVAMGGAGALFAAVPPARRVLAVAGCGYLSWLGVRLVAAAGRERPAGFENVEGEREPASGVAFSASVGGLLAFQFLNPKAWVLVLTACAAAPARLDGVTLYLGLGALLLIIAPVSLLLWALLGAGVERLLGWRAERRWLDRGLGALLVASALLLLVEAWR